MSFDHDLDAAPKGVRLQLACDDVQGRRVTSGIFVQPLTVAGAPTWCDDNGAPLAGVYAWQPYPEAPSSKP